MKNPIQQKYLFQPRRSKENILQTLRQQVGKQPSISWGNSGLPNIPFMGKVDENSFEITRVYRGRNSFRPLVKGKFITNKHQSTTIEVSLNLHPIILVILLIIGIQLLMFGLFFIPTAISALMEFKSFEDIFPLFPFILFPIVFGVFYFVYKSECSKVIAFLEETFGVRAEKV